MTLRLTPEEGAAFNRQRTEKSPAPRRAEEAGFQRSVIELEFQSWLVDHAMRQAVNAAAPPPRPPHRLWRPARRP